jgi:hypothetical protein
MLPLLNDLLQKDFVENAYPFGEFHHVVMKDRSGEEKLQQFIQNRSNEKAVLQEAQPDIEDCFISLMKN